MKEFMEFLHMFEFSASDEFISCKKHRINHLVRSPRVNRRRDNKWVTSVIHFHR